MISYGTYLSPSFDLKYKHLLAKQEAKHFGWPTATKQARKEGGGIQTYIPSCTKLILSIALEFLAFPALSSSMLTIMYAVAAGIRGPDQYRELKGRSMEELAKVSSRKVKLLLVVILKQKKTTTFLSAVPLSFGFP